LITHVDTTTAPVSDDARTAIIHEGLKQKDLMPDQHIVDTGYVDAQLLHRSQQDYGIDLVGPTRPDVKWQAQQQMGYDAGHFDIDWQAEQATCPQGHTSISWTPAIDNRKNEVIKIKFSTKDCQSCPSRSLCTHSTRTPRRTITVRPELHYLALQRARERAKTEDFKALYARRAGVEGTISKASSCDGAAPLPLYRPRKNASPASCHSGGYEYRSSDALARWGTSCSNQALGFGSVTSPGCLKNVYGFASSITTTVIYTHGLFHTCSPGHGCLPASNAGNYSHKLHVSNEPCREERSRRYDGIDEARRR
jgi:hypothetical protein